MTTKRSPLKGNPLNNPGQRLNQEINDDILNGVTRYYLPACFSLIISVVELVRWYLSLPPSLTFVLIYSLTSLAICTWSLCKLIQLKKIVHRKHLGREGERCVGQYLERLRAKGYHIFHDIDCEGFNIDHVIIAQQGIFTIETKTYSKPERGPCEIFVTDADLKVNQQSRKKVLKQAAGQAEWLKGFFHSRIGLNILVKPIIVFPGWFVRSAQTDKSSLWVLNPKALPKYITNEPEMYTVDQVKQFSMLLDQFVREQHG